MRAAIISQGSISSQWVVDECKKLFDAVDALDIKDFEVSLGGKEPQVFYQGKPLEHEYDCIYAKGSFRYVTLLRSLTTILGKACYMPIKGPAFTAGHDKLLTHLVLQSANVPQPKTYVVSTSAAGKKLLKKIDYPLVMKLPAGTHGKGVMLADSIESASSMIDALALLKQPFLMQEYVETNGTDTRAFVVGDDVVASMKRTAAEGEKRANIHAGGKAIACEIDAYAKKVALDTARAVGADICAVDMLMGPKGKPMVIEINLSPGLQGITRATKVNVAQRIARFLHQKAKEFRIKQAGLAIKEVVPEKEVITRLDFRGNRMLLPELVTTLTKLSDEEVVIKLEKGKFSIERVTQ
ncbi:RimK family alpha-L-glutamate ligase [Candidatus Woesearchaeota archaeon]|nr:RimK family alpha-L-glutamate ligase [Candidatus Woesearchaeota archaeon]